jgi:hypothetical protein
MRVFVSRYRWTIWIGGALALVLALFFGLRYSVRTQDCSHHETVLPSPDGTHKARLVNEACDFIGVNNNNAYWVAVGPSSGGWFGHETAIFLSWDSAADIAEFAPDVAWSDDHHLVITIQYVSNVRTSLHEADGVTVIYRLADRLSEENFRKNTEEYERRAEEDLRNHVSTFTGNPEKDPAALKDLIARTWKDYQRFKEWAKANAENGGI